MLIMKHIVSAFDFAAFKVMLRSFNALLSKWPVTGKRLDVEQNELKLDIRGRLVNIYDGTFDFVVLRSVGVIQCTSLNLV